MNAGKYNAAEAHRLIESAYDPHEKCRVRMKFAEDTILFLKKYERRYRISVAVNLALVGIVIWMVFK